LIDFTKLPVGHDKHPHTLLCTDKLYWAACWPWKHPHTTPCIDQLYLATCWTCHCHLTLPCNGKLCRATYCPVASFTPSCKFSSAEHPKPWKRPHSLSYVDRLCQVTQLVGHERGPHTAMQLQALPSNLLP
jgi:hypothetical protein